MSYRPLPKEVTIKQSGIDGLGLFASEFICRGTNLGITHIPNNEYENGYIRTPLGGFINHSNIPNLQIVISESGNYLVETLTDVNAGEELTLKYNLYKVGK
tara:strand:- start:79 stop:381 length:303 start_codon:yes stop_codon:yes gene_type:complete